MQRQENMDLCYTCERRSGATSKREPDQIFPLLVRPIYQNLRVRDSNGFTNCWETIGANNRTISETPSQIGLFRPNLAFSSPPPTPREQTQRWSFQVQISRIKSREGRYKRGDCFSLPKRSYFSPIRLKKIFSCQLFFFLPCPGQKGHLAMAPCKHINQAFTPLSSYSMMCLKPSCSRWHVTGIVSVDVGRKEVVPRELIPKERKQRLE